MTVKPSIDQALIQKLIAIIEVNLENENFGVAELATEIGLSRSQLHRRLQDINGKSTSQFIREYRLEKAMEMLKLNQATASEIAYRVGFTSPTYFNTSFHNFYGYPPGEVKNQRTITPPKKTYSKKLMGVIPILILVGLIVFSKVFNKKSVETDAIIKTIAVLPFINDSNNEDNMYFCNGIMAGIRDYLAKIPEFSVVSRRSVELYRDSLIPIKTIAKELDVNYVVEGHVQRIGNRAIISAELIRVNDNKIIWSDSYDKDVSEIFTVQANVIQSITSNLETIISPNLKNELNTKPTQDTLAYVHYLKGEEYRFKADIQKQEYKVWLDLISKAKASYSLAIKNDSLYCNAYIGLAQTTFERYSPNIDDDNALDDMLTYTDKAIQLNPNSSSAYLIRGDYYRQIKQRDQAIKDYEKSLEIIPNNSSALYRLTFLYRRNHNYKDAVLTLKRLEKFSKSRDDLIRLYNAYIYFYGILDQHNMVDYYFNKIFETQTTATFNVLRYLTFVDTHRFDEAIAYTEKFLKENNVTRNATLGFIYFSKKDFATAITYYKKCYDLVETEGINTSWSDEFYGEYGVSLISVGQIEKGTEMIKKQVLINDKMLTSKRRDWPITSLQSARYLLYINDLEQAYKNLEQFDAVNGWLFYEGTVFGVKRSIYFDNLMNDPIFKASFESAEKQVLDIQNQIRPYLPLTPPAKTD